MTWLAVALTWEAWLFLTVGMVISARRQGRGVAIVDYLLLDGVVHGAHFGYRALVTERSAPDVCCSQRVHRSFCTCRVRHRQRKKEEAMNTLHKNIRRRMHQVRRVQAEERDNVAGLLRLSRADIEARAAC